jgi:hypothetical protein
MDAAGFDRKSALSEDDTLMLGALLGGSISSAGEMHIENQDHRLKSKTVYTPSRTHETFGGYY